MNIPKIRKRRRNKGLPRYEDGKPQYSWQKPDWESSPALVRGRELVADSKAEILPFMVDDYYYRYNKQHPDVNVEQIQNVFDNQKIRTIDDVLYNEYPNVTKNSAGMFMHSNLMQDYVNNANKKLADVYGLPPIYDTQDQIVMPRNYKTKAINSNNLVHEMGHAYDHNLGERTQYEKDLINEAYNNNIFIAPGSLNVEGEKFSTNTQLRNLISKQYGNATGLLLDEHIKNMPEQTLYNMYSNVNGYTNASPLAKTAQVEYTPEPYANWLSDLKNADEMRDYKEYVKYATAIDRHKKGKPVDKQEYKAAKKYFNTKNGYVERKYSDNVKSMYEQYVRGNKKFYMEKPVVVPKSMDKIREALLNVAYNAPKQLINHMV